MPVRILLLRLLLVFAPPGLAAAHDGFLDSYGCHYNQATRHYHCHRGPLAGKAFKSEAHMREALQEAERREPRRAAKPFSSR